MGAPLHGITSGNYGFYFSYIPMSGILMAFQDYKPALGFFDSEWVGLKHFRYMWENDYFLQITWNTLFLLAPKLF